MHISKERQGEMFILGETALWGLFPIISILTFSTLSPLTTAGLSTIVASIFFGTILTIRRGWRQLAVRGIWRDILWITLLIGIMYYTLLFIGLYHTTAGNASIMAEMEVFFSMFILHVWNKEKATIQLVLGAILMILGATIILFQGTLRLDLGSGIILLATLFPPMANYFQKRVRTKINSEAILFCRSVLSGIFLLTLAWVFDGMPTMHAITASSTFLLINGIFLMGLSKIFWIEGIHRMSIGKSISLSPITPAFTLLFAFLFLHDVPTIWQLSGFVPIIFGVHILTKKIHSSRL